MGEGDLGESWNDLGVEEWTTLDKDLECPKVEVRDGPASVCAGQPPAAKVIKLCHTRLARAIRQQARKRSCSG